MSMNDKEYTRALLEEIRAVKQDFALMEVCGTHTMAIAKSGIRELVPPNLKLLSGPGCPVCVTAQGDIDSVIAMAGNPDITLLTFGDMLREPRGRCKGSVFAFRCGSDGGRQSGAGNGVLRHWV